MLIGRQGIRVVIGVLLLAASCKKHEPEVDPPHGTDSLVQSIYSVYRSVRATSDGYILLAPFATPDTPARLMLMDGDGHLLWERVSPVTVLDFKKWNNNGQVRYTWLEQEPDLFPGAQIGDIVVADSSLNVLKRVSILAHGVVTDPAKNGYDGHDFILLGDDHYIAMGYINQHVTNVPASLGTGGAAYVVCPVLQEVKNGQVIWQWEGTKYPEFYTNSTFGNDYNDMSRAQDYMHINSMFIDPNDGNIICSFRSLDQVIKINRQSGDIMWRLGGSNSDFDLTSDMRFMRQHNATIVDGGRTLLLFDNGDLATRAYSRILEFQLSESTHSITGFKSFKILAPFSRIMSSVQKIGNHYFIGGGSGNFVLEIDYTTGEKILELKSNANIPTYRAYKF